MADGMANDRSKNSACSFFGSAPDDKMRRAYGIRIAIFFVLVLILVAVLFLLYQFAQALYQLNAVELERDRWQRPADVIDSLNLKEGDVVADVGCGVGYFSLKLASKVGERGAVLGEDILDQSLAFLRIRAFLQNRSNIRAIRGGLGDPHLPNEGVDAVLIANSYHEFTQPRAILDHIFQALRSNARLVVLDRGARLYHGEPRIIQMQQYQIAASVVEEEIRKSGFEVIRRDDRFIDRPATERPGDRPDDHVWWLIVARKP